MKHKEAFQILESIDAPSYELALVVPVLLNLKPASTITLIRDDEDTHSVDKKLQEMGLITKVDLRDNNPRWHEIPLARNRENLQKILESNENYSRGIAYGYPLSAVEASRDGTLLHSDQREPKNVFIISFGVSTSNHKEERKLMEQWNEAVRIHTPKIYKAFQELELKP